MKIYIVQTKIFYKNDGIEHQVADALEPLTVLSSKKKANSAMQSYQSYYEKLGYERKEKYNCLFPVEHFEMLKGDYRVVIYTIESEVE